MTPPSQGRDGTAIAIPTVKQHLASLRMLFDWLITGQVIDANPTAAFRAWCRSPPPSPPGSPVPAPARIAAAIAPGNRHSRRFPKSESGLPHSYAWYFAAIALTHGLELSTGNTAHFQRVQQLGYPQTLVNWRV